MLYLGIPAAIGSILGAQIAVSLDDTLMNRVIGIIMVIMLFVIILQPKRWLSGEMERLEKTPTLFQYFLFFLIGIYGGFIQAGVGIFLLCGLVLSVGYNIVRANAVKIGIVLFFTVFALAVFIIHYQVNWQFGIILALGNMLGAWVGSKVAVKHGAVWVRRLLIAVVSVSAVKLLGLFNLATQWFN